jgi:hypothetical protein
LWQSYDGSSEKFSEKISKILLNIFVLSFFIFYRGGRAAAEKSGASTLLFVKTHFL